SPFGIDDARNTRTEKPMPAHALDPQIRLLESTLPIGICCCRGEKRSPSASLLIPALFAPVVAKKPHNPLNGGRLGSPRQQLRTVLFLCDIPALHRRRALQRRYQ